MTMNPTARSDAVLAEDVRAIVDVLMSLEATAPAATLIEAADRLDSERDEEVTADGPVSERSRDELVDRFTAAVENACDVAAIEVVVHELEVAPEGWRRDGRTSPLRRLVRAMEGAGLLDYESIGEES